MMEELPGEGDRNALLLASGGYWDVYNSAEGDTLLTLLLANYTSIFKMCRKLYVLFQNCFLRYVSKNVGYHCSRHFAKIIVSLNHTT